MYLLHAKVLESILVSLCGLESSLVGIPKIIFLATDLCENFAHVSDIVPTCFLVISGRKLK